MINIIFGMHVWEYVKEVQSYCGHLNFKHLVDK